MTVLPVEKEIENKIQNIADTKKILIMTFIAPDSVVRNSPASYDYASIRVKDLYKIEKEVEDLKTKNRLPKQLHLIIQTPGGELYTATKIARYLEQNFDEIEAYVAYEAASGGTLLCLTAKTIVMDTTGNLTPIDPQVPYKGLRVSATSYEQAIKDFKKEHGNERPEEIPSPYRQMGSVFEPILAKEMKQESLG